MTEGSLEEKIELLEDRIELLEEGMAMVAFILNEITKKVFREEEKIG